MSSIKTNTFLHFMFASVKSMARWKAEGASFIPKVSKYVRKSQSWVIRVLHQYDEETGERKVKNKKGRPRKTTAEEDQTAINLQIKQSRQNKGGIAVWGAICAAGRVALVRFQGIMNSEKYEEVLFDQLLPYLDANGRDLTYQQDNAPCHTSAAMKSSSRRKTST
ncbi:uncharacterized protein LOC129599056 [Paramacrobiotus metropolitanus]|uniref:uncharacterized protein LOC129599056 n=1 Tax=Paramacrobiotus metropolitanus TaxID=2943436 RepID=UPI0024456942|nr:uncharacterized protein LOC129599056 [Paramacrobiotus metropolitanus]